MMDVPPSPAGVCRGWPETIVSKLRFDYSCRYGSQCDSAGHSKGATGVQFYSMNHRTELGLRDYTRPPLQGKSPGKGT